MTRPKFIDVFKISSVNPLDYRFDVALQQWILDPDWWRELARKSLKGRE